VKAFATAARLHRAAHFSSRRICCPADIHRDVVLFASRRPRRSRYALAAHLRERVPLADESIAPPAKTHERALLEAMPKSGQA